VNFNAIVRRWDEIHQTKERFMSLVMIGPDALPGASRGLTGIGSGLAGRNATVAKPTMIVISTSRDEVSALTAAQFVACAEMYQASSAPAISVHEMFVNALGADAGSYAAAEAANAVATN